MTIELTDTVKALHANACALRELDLTRAGDGEFRDAWLLFEQASRILDGFVANRMIAEVAVRDLPGKPGTRALIGYLKDHLHLSGREAHRRVHDAADLADRLHADGTPRESANPRLTEAQFHGRITAEHAHTVREVLRRIPDSVAPEDKAKAALVLTELAGRGTPEDVKTAGARVLGYLNPDGHLTSNQDRARHRGLRLCNQDSDLMTRLSGALDPQTRALLDVVLAKWAAPGANNQDDPQSPRGATDADASLLEAAAGRDRRTQEQRNHDGLRALLLWALNSGGLGEHNGLPMHLVATASLRDIEDEAGVATTATGTIVPVADLLGMAARKRAYLLLFDHNQRPLHFFHARRTANLDQRLVLFATERGCTRPTCRVPAAGCQAHHRRRDHQHGSDTGIDDLTLVCPGDHRVLDENDGVRTPTGWYTRVGDPDGPNPGRTEWVPPATMDPQRRARVNNAHHAEHLLNDAGQRIQAQRDAEFGEWSRQKNACQCNSSSRARPEHPQPGGGRRQTEWSRPPRWTRNGGGG